ncbi:ABC transporter substrate-binding protein [Martelella sp. HB161492]|uniref:ABC transporter substrate-binding protein n=1 Tax=Martelella sp. HB161492 TaxID=2720726 RepID=UPI001590656D|nr:ABC transporter substrate-binding protein [Martelella sp. HB161492]
MQNFHISATGHSLNYLPEYVAVWQGFFREEELEVTTEVPSPWDLVLDQIGSDKANAALGGIWVPSMFHTRGKRYIPFAQVAARAPLAVIGRERPENFAWGALPGKVIAMKGSNGASVGLFIKMLLREHGIDPRTVNFVQDLDGKMLTDLFVGGMADYLVIDYPSAATLEASGRAHVVAPLSISGGNIPWSVFYTDGEASAAALDVHCRFVRALGRGMDWINARPAEEYRTFLAETFPKFAPDILVRLTDVYRENGMWTTPRIDPDAYQRWQNGICDGHLTSAPIAYETLIDTRPTAA